MSDSPADLKYTKSHEWVRTLADGNVEVGITDHAQSALGDLVFVDVPEAGKSLKAGDTFAVVESVKAASDVYAPWPAPWSKAMPRWAASPNSSIPNRTRAAGSCVSSRRARRRACSPPPNTRRISPPRVKTCRSIRTRPKTSATCWPPSAPRASMTCSTKSRRNCASSRWPAFRTRSMKCRSGA